MRILIPALLLLASCAAPAPAPAPKVEPAPDEGRVTLQMQQANVREILDQIGRQGRLTIIVNGDVQGRATLSLNNIPTREALTAVAKTFDLKLTDEAGGIVRVSARRRS